MVGNNLKGVQAPPNGDPTVIDTKYDRAALLEGSKLREISSLTITAKVSHPVMQILESKELLQRKLENNVISEKTDNELELKSKVENELKNFHADISQETKIEKLDTVIIPGRNESPSKSNHHQSEAPKKYSDKWPPLPSHSSSVKKSRKEDICKFCRRRVPISSVESQTEIKSLSLVYGSLPLQSPPLRTPPIAEATANKDSAGDNDIIQRDESGGKCGRSWCSLGRRRRKLTLPTARKHTPARRRQRREIAQAFTTLREILPSSESPPDVEIDSNAHKMSTLRLATSYIRALSDLLRETHIEESMSITSSGGSEDMSGDHHSSADSDKMSTGIPSGRHTRETSMSDDPSPSDCSSPTPPLAKSNLSPTISSSDVHQTLPSSEASAFESSTSKQSSSSCGSIVSLSVSQNLTSCVISDISESGSHIDNRFQCTQDLECV